jgi:hypothetical protein
MRLLVVAGDEPLLRRKSGKTVKSAEAGLILKPPSKDG